MCEHRKISAVSRKCGWQYAAISFTLRSIFLHIRSLIQHSLARNAHFMQEYRSITLIVTHYGTKYMICSCGGFAGVSCYHHGTFKYPPASWGEVGYGKLCGKPFSDEGIYP